MFSSNLEVLISIHANGSHSWTCGALRGELFPAYGRQLTIGERNDTMAVPTASTIEATFLAEIPNETRQRHSLRSVTVQMEHCRPSFS